MGPLLMDCSVAQAAGGPDIRDLPEGRGCDAWAQYRQNVIVPYYITYQWRVMFSP